jgi:hypothetical protein
MNEQESFGFELDEESRCSYLEYKIVDSGERGTRPVCQIPHMIWMELTDQQVHLYCKTQLHRRCKHSNDFVHSTAPGKILDFFA